MNLSDQELSLYAIRETQLILADAGQPGSRDSQDVVQELRDLLSRSDVVEAVDRLEANIGLRLA